ncbi:hypothetical protein R1X32_11845 [Rhodococcus opacus]|uniref:hypothetical protein n=1 Tax=Rhodococcus opacus TaxID=37919 RepID=UPI0034D34D79
MDAGRIPTAVRRYYAAFDRPAVEISIELGRELILGRRRMRVGPAEPADTPDGGAPPRSWVSGTGRVGSSSEDGQPFYLVGPYDNPAAAGYDPRAVRGCGEHVSVAAGPM